MLSVAFPEGENTGKGKKHREKGKKGRRG